MCNFNVVGMNMFIVLLFLKITEGIGYVLDPFI